MARLLIGAAFGVVVGVVGGAALGLHAQDPQTDLDTAAHAAHVNPTDLKGAMLSTGIDDPYVYLQGVGELPSPTSSKPPPPLAPAASARRTCIVRVESHGDPKAHNPSGASGLGQFLPGTWASTPQGRAGLSVYDPVANLAAIDYMLAAGRAREFDAVRIYGC